MIKTWEQYHSDIICMVHSLGDYRPDIIVPCMRGGMIPGAVAAEMLGVTDVRPIEIGREGDQRFLAYDLRGGINSKSLLLVEDSLRTGKGPRAIRDIFSGRGASGVKIAAVYVTPTSRGTVDFFGEVCEELPGLPYKPCRAGDKLRSVC